MYLDQISTTNIILRRTIYANNTALYIIIYIFLNLISVPNPVYHTTYTHTHTIPTHDREERPVATTDVVEVAIAGVFLRIDGQLQACSQQVELLDAQLRQMTAIGYLRLNRRSPPEAAQQRSQQSSLPMHFHATCSDYSDQTYLVFKLLLCASIAHRNKLSNALRTNASLSHQASVVAQAWGTIRALEAYQQQHQQLIALPLFI